MSIEKIKELMENKEFVAGILEMESPEEVQNAFAEKGVDLTIDQVKQIATMAFSDGSAEIPEEELDAVSGGITLEAICIIAGGVKLFFDIATEVNKSRTSKGKKPIW